MRHLLFIILVFISIFTSLESIAQNKKILAIFAHADDEIVMSTSLSKFVRDGHSVTVAYATDGSWGVTEHSDLPAGKVLAKAREKEMQCAAQHLGVLSPIFFGFEDGKLANYSNLQPLHDKISALIAKIQPDVIFTWGPEGGYGHPDHRTVSNVTTEVFQKIANPESQSLFYPGLPEQPQASLPTVETFIGKFFKHNFHRSKPAFLPLKKTYQQSDFNAAYTSHLCHKSQYTEKQNADIFALKKTLNYVDYFRPWGFQPLVHQKLFD